MKKLPVILNIVLAVAVVVLYILHFTTPGNKSGNKSSNDTLKSAMPTQGIVYVNIDSVYANYQMYKDVFADLQSKLNSSDAQLKSKQTTFQKNVTDYQYKLERGLITRAEAAQMEQNLGQQQQQLLGLQQDLEGKLAEEQAVAQRKVLNSIIEYLSGHKDEQSYQYVFFTTFGGNILYANDNFDITKSVTEGLNEAYNKSKEDSKNSEK